MNSNQFGALLEDMDGKLDAVLESLSFMATKAQVDALDNRLQSVESNVRIIKGVVKEHSITLAKHTTMLTEHGQIFSQNGLRLQESKS